MVLVLLQQGNSIPLIFTQLVLTKHLQRQKEAEREAPWLKNGDAGVENDLDSF